MPFYRVFVVRVTAHPQRLGTLRMKFEPNYIKAEKMLWTKESRVGDRHLIQSGIHY